MDELKRRALAQLPMSPAGVREAYAASGCSPHARRVVRELCESHERLRAELEGTAAMLRDAEAGAERLSAEVWRLRGALERIAGGEGCRADLLVVKTLEGGEDDD